MPKTTPKPKNVTPGNHKLIGKNYITPDLMAKVTGQAKYAEDYRADGMLFCKLLLSPVPHGRVKRIDTSAALRSMLRMCPCGTGLSSSLQNSMPSAR